MPPATPSATPSGIVAKDGERVVPASVRADGSYVGAAYAGFARSAACAQAIRPMRMWRGSAHRVCCRRTARDLRPAARVSAGPRRGRHRGRQRGRPSRSPLALDGTSRPTRASAKESAQASAKETIRPPAKKPPGKEPDAANPREKDQGPTTDTTPEWRSAARPRTKAERPRSRAEREPRPKPQAPPADAESTLDTLGESLSALSIKDRRV